MKSSGSIVGNEELKGKKKSSSLSRRIVHINYFFNTCALKGARIYYFTRMVSETVSL
jgi:hypothetical protein